MKANSDPSTPPLTCGFVLPPGETFRPETFFRRLAENIFPPGVFRDLQKHLWEKRFSRGLSKSDIKYFHPNRTSLNAPETASKNASSEKYFPKTLRKTDPWRDGSSSRITFMQVRGGATGPKLASDADSGPCPLNSAPMGVISR